MSPFPLSFPLGSPVTVRARCLVLPAFLPLPLLLRALRLLRTVSLRATPAPRFTARTVAPPSRFFFRGGRAGLSGLAGPPRSAPASPPCEPCTATG